MESRPANGDSDPNSNPVTNSVGPPSALTYLDPHYWDERFSSEEHYEWFKDYSHFQHLIKSNITTSSSVLSLLDPLCCWMIVETHTSSLDFFNCKNVILIFFVCAWCNEGFGAGMWELSVV